MSYHGYELRFRVKLNVLESVFKVKYELMRHVIEMLNRSYTNSEFEGTRLVRMAYEESIFRVDANGKDIELLEYEYTQLGKELVGHGEHGTKKFKKKKLSKK